LIGSNRTKKNRPGPGRLRLPGRQLMLTGLIGMVHAGVPSDTRDKKFEKDIITGLISLILLAITANSRRPMYGYQIARQMKAERESDLELKQGTIYPVLRTMEKKGMLKSEIKASESGPPRKYYHITKTGRKKLKVWTETWNRTKRFTDHILEGNINGRR